MITQAQQDAIAKAWKGRAEGMEYGKPTSARYRKAQADFVSGAMAALNALHPNENPELMSPEVPPAWVFDVLRGNDVFA